MTANPTTIGAVGDGGIGGMTTPIGSIPATASSSSITLISSPLASTVGGAGVGASSSSVHVHTLHDNVYEPVYQTLTVAQYAKTYGKSQTPIVIDIGESGVLWLSATTILHIHWLVINRCI
jgi:microcystin degradation protein MlrC